MILTVTLNAAIDQTWIVPDFRVHAIHRSRRVIRQPGGKGVNVARVLHALGTNVCATGFVGGQNGRWMMKALESDGIPSDFVWIGKETRTCLTFLDPDHGTQTEVLEPGPTVSEVEWHQLTAKVATWAERSSMVACCGSLPPGVPEDAYGELIRIARSRGATVWLDTSGKALQNGWAVRPDGIKVNQDEAGHLLGKVVSSRAETIAAARQLVRDAGQTVIVTAGVQGLAAVVGGETYWVTPPTVQAVNPVGSGDAFLAGWLSATHQRKSREEALALATACAAANALRETAGIEKQQVSVLLKEVRVEKVVD
ncbi:1-phosphofructokinase family hexose kinase [Polycladomyces sp. WAk]|uniref:Tagatose-6-phosphate kinase n=1 Tax=Polycladomyces zharkentensis TaxID=2807616 RepID=A0ABS2WG23_9BACL|nr:1-phosphofructokinase family hexose kinase [Polycladomyces sp. WAk]MBN2908500.1 1-phosphofructokinase family hexose kinase [Polycladomyces sp. WAk]